MTSFEMRTHWLSPLIHSLCNVAKIGTQPYGANEPELRHKRNDYAFIGECGRSTHGAAGDEARKWPFRCLNTESFARNTYKCLEVFRAKSRLVAPVHWGTLCLCRRSSSVLRISGDNSRKNAHIS